MDIGQATNTVVSVIIVVLGTATLVLPFAIMLKVLVTAGRGRVQTTRALHEDYYRRGLVHEVPPWEEGAA